MIKRTTYEYDIKHNGDEMERAEITALLDQLATMIEDAGLASVTFEMGMNNLITVRVHTVDAP